MAISYVELTNSVLTALLKNKLIDPDKEKEVKEVIHAAISCREPQRLYYHSFHLHAALKCLDAGYPENASSWMDRDLEYEERADPKSLMKVQAPWDSSKMVISYLPLEPQ